MSSVARSRAEEQFAATQRHRKNVKSEAEQLQQERADKTARLRSLRLEKEAAEREAADARAAAKASGRTGPNRHA